MNNVPRLDEWLFETIDFWLETQVNDGSAQVENGQIVFFVTTPDEAQTFSKPIGSITSLIKWTYDDERSNEFQALATDLRAAVEFIDQRLAAGPPTRRQELEERRARIANQIDRFIKEQDEVSQELDALDEDHG